MVKEKTISKRTKKTFRKGLEGWQKKLELIEEIAKTGCPVCPRFRLTCAISNCPLYNDQQLCERTWQISTDITSLRDNINHLVRKLSLKHKEAGLL